MLTFNTRSQFISQINKKFIMAFLIVNAYATHSYAQNSLSGLQAMRQFIAQKHSISGEFIQSNQTKHSQQYGQFAMSKPDYFLWEIKKPFEQLLISDGKTLTQWDIDLNQATQRSSIGLLDNTPAALLIGGSSVEKQFNLQDLGNFEGLNWVKATPNKKDSSFKSIQLGFKHGLPSVLLIQDELGSINRIELKKIKVNSVDLNVFQLSLPKDVDIVKM